MHFEIYADTRCKSPRWVAYWLGRDDCHIMDWRGCNFRRIKIKNQPKFDSYWEAHAWASNKLMEREKRGKERIKRIEENGGRTLGYQGFTVEGTGTHIGERNEFDPRQIDNDDFRVRGGREFTQEEWDNLKEEYREWKRTGGY